MEHSAETLQTIRQMAYRLWEEAGRPDDAGDHFWLEAERLYCARHHCEDDPTVVSVVQEASEESFPASDAPAWTGAAATGSGAANQAPEIQIPSTNGANMAKLTIEGVSTVEVPHGKRLVLALTQDAGIDQLHACGGKARCTTCRVEFLSGEPEQMTVAERDVLAAKGLTGVRLSCQILCDHDMSVRATSRLEGSGRKDAGHEPSPEIEPPPEWIEK
jgi:ferredoxin